MLLTCKHVDWKVGSKEDILMLRITNQFNTAFNIIANFIMTLQKFNKVRMGVKF